jgi:hypothetical protein
LFDVEPPLEIQGLAAATTEFAYVFLAYLA